MRTLPTFFSFVAAVTATQFPRYEVPSGLIADASCTTLPTRFVVSNFTTNSVVAGTGPSTVSFAFLDPDTRIQTWCSRNSTSQATGPSKNIYPCDNSAVSFVYQTTGIAGLTLVEQACPSQSPAQDEASGSVNLHLVCTNTTTSSNCVARPSSINGTFSSFEPIPQSASTRRIRGAWRG
ncbi:hypothetical protein F5Y16DRAFT_12255 [Xylariaceae sp. FL0255]|nr:hypothetical protein F5Y16DRAFT_12255 [Xylariaceae sp. FL0255]